MAGPVYYAAGKERKLTRRSWPLVMEVYGNGRLLMTKYHLVSSVT